MTKFLGSLCWPGPGRVKVDPPFMMAYTFIYVLKKGLHLVYRFSCPQCSPYILIWPQVLLHHRHSNLKEKRETKCGDWPLVTPSSVEDMKANYGLVKVSHGGKITYFKKRETIRGSWSYWTRPKNFPSGQFKWKNRLAELYYSERNTACQTGRLLVGWSIHLATKPNPKSCNLKQANTKKIQRGRECVLLTTLCHSIRMESKHTKLDNTPKARNELVSIFKNSTTIGLSCIIWRPTEVNQFASAIAICL